MPNRAIFFSVDRLGDYLIRSNVIKQISDEYDYNEIVCSNINFKLISKQSFFNKVVEYNKNKNSKLNFKKYFLKNMMQLYLLMEKIQITFIFY